MRTFLAVVLGAVTGSLVLLIVGMINNALHPTPPELMDPATPEAVARRVAAAGTRVWISTIFGLALGAFLGGMAGAGIAGRKKFPVTLAIGVALSGWAMYTFYVVYPQVLWVPLAMLLSALLFPRLGGVALYRLKR